MSAVVASNEAASPPAATRPLALSGRVSALLAIASGLLYFLAFPGVDLWPLGFVGLVPLIVALRGQSPRRALWLGWLAGFTMTMCGFYWLLNMLETFSGFPLPLCVLFMAILCAYQAGRIGLLGWLYARAERHGWPPALAFAVAFAASEQAFPLLFPWSYAATVHQLPALLQVAEIGGPILVALTLVAINLAVAELVLSRLEGRRPRHQSVALLAAVPVVSALYGAVRIIQVDAAVAAAAPAEVGLVQANMSLFGKRRDKQEGLRRHHKLTRQLLQKGKLDLVVWSETSVMSAIPESAAEKEIPEKISSKLDIPALFGAVLTRPVQDVRGKVYFNSAVLTNRKGKVVGRYDKQFLLAFGEYLPLGETFPILYQWSPNSGRFTHGKSMLPLTVGGHQIATFICYEDIVPGFVNEIVRAGEPDLLANLTNDAWFGDTTEPWIHLALSKLRAIEHRRFFVRSTNSGVSAFIDPVGRVLAHTETFQEQALRARLAWMRGTTAYEVLGDVPWWLAVLLAGALAFIYRPGSEDRRKRSAIAAPPEPADRPGNDSADSAAAARAFRDQARRWLRRAE
jgi:apolipoprotein N-acyltransferase